MSAESFNASEGLPEEITINEEFQVDAEGKKYLYEKDGVKYGGDYLPETPAEVSLEENDDFPPPPEEVNPVL